MKVAIRVGDRYVDSVRYEGGVRYYGDVLPDVRPSNKRLDCKYCYTDEASTVESWYLIHDVRSVQLLCENCGAGLTPCENSIEECLAAVPWLWTGDSD